MAKQVDKPKIKVITPPNALLLKAGRGGLPDHIIAKAEGLIQNTSFDIKPAISKDYKTLKALITPHLNDHTSPDEQTSKQLDDLAMLIRANAGLFHYTLIHEISDSLVFVLDYIDEYSTDAVNLLRLLLRILDKILDSASPHDLLQHEAQLVKEVEQAVMRYCKRHKRSTAKK